MKHILKKLSFALLLGSTVVIASASPYGAQLCREDDRFQCISAGKGENWSLIKSDASLRDLVNRINRVNVGLSGMIAVPKNLQEADLFAVSPFPLQMPSPNEKLLLIDLDKLAWGAYDPKGQLLRWGPIAPGKSWCPDDARACQTKTGKFAIYNKQGAACKSRKYPKPNGGAKMPYCSFFHGGFAIHAGKLPGQPDSHGCVRTYLEDAKWLSQDFLELGTKVYVKPYEKM